MKNFFRSVGAFMRAMPHFLAFELILKLLLAIGTPVLVLLLKLTMKLSGISYLNDENLLVYIKHPATILVIILMLFFYALFSFVELSALAGCFACFSKGERLTVGGMFRTGTRAFKKAVKGAGIFNFIRYMTIMPLAQFSLSAGMFMAPLLPVLRRLFSSLNGIGAAAVFILIELLFVILILSGSYSLHYLILTDSSFVESAKKSRRAVSSGRLKRIINLFLWTILVFAVTALITFGVSFIIIFVLKGFSKPGAAFGKALKVLKYAWNVFTAVSAFFSAPAIMCWLTQKFLGDVRDEEIILPNRYTKKIGRAKGTVIIISLITVGALMNFSYFKALYKGNISLNVGIITRTQVTAHRGFSRVAPENTMPAFQAALDSGADYIELDVQLTRDGQLVVFHDDTIERTTNGRGVLTNYTYEQLQAFSAGAWFGKDGEFSDVKIPLFDEVLDLVGRDILLNIEIKRSGNVNATAEKVVELIEAHGIEDSCYVTSFSYPALKKVKKLNPKIKTGLIANLATATSYSHLPYIDAVSMNYLFVNQSVVNSAHHNGKRIFVWTVDRQSEMQKMMALGVDNIITNRPDKALEVVDSKKVGDSVLTALKYIFGNG